MREALSLMFDHVGRDLVALFGTRAGVVNCDWDAAKWTWAGEEQQRPSIPDAFALHDFIAVLVPCRCSAGNNIQANLWVEADASSTFFVAITPQQNLWSESVQRWIESWQILSPVLDPIFRPGIHFRIGIEVSTPHEPRGALLNVTCYSTDDMVSAYRSWRKHFVEEFPKAN